MNTKEAQAALARSDEIKQRQLEIAAALTASRSAFLSGQGSGFMSHPERAALEAEVASLTLERFKLEKTLRLRKKAVDLLRAATLHATILRMLIERGDLEFIDKARTASAEAFEAIYTQGASDGEE